MTRSTRRHRRAPLHRRLEPQPERHAATVDTRPVYVPRPRGHQWDSGLHANVSTCRVCGLRRQLRWVNDQPRVNWTTADDAHCGSFPATDGPEDYPPCPRPRPPQILMSLLAMAAPVIP